MSGGMFLVWTDREALKFRAFHDLMEAVLYAKDGGHLVTEVVPLGDPRLLYTESIAKGDFDLFGSVGAEAIERVREAARSAVKEASKFDFQSGRVARSVSTDDTN